MLHEHEDDKTHRPRRTIQETSLLIGFLAGYKWDGMVKEMPGGFIGGQVKFTACNGYRTT